MNPSTRGPVVVIGSINMDLVCRTPRIPAAGETVLAGDLTTVPGGKGANQAVAAARLGGDVHMVGRVGDDPFGRRLLQGLRDNRVGAGHVAVTEDVSSGCAMILVEEATGENCIVVAPGANARLTPADVDAAADLVRSASAVMLQLEVPLDAVRHALALCRSAGVFTILDPAPVPPGPLPADLFGVDVLTPNREEAERLLGRVRAYRAAAASPPSDPEQIGADLLSRGARTVVLKLGADGAALIGRGGAAEHVPPFGINAVDTTAAGDAVTGALAVARAEGMAMPRAVRFANAAGAICCQSFGAQPSLPDRAAVEAFMASR